MIKRLLWKSTRIIPFLYCSFSSLYCYYYYYCHCQYLGDRHHIIIIIVIVIITISVHHNYTFTMNVLEKFLVTELFNKNDMTLSLWFLLSTHLKFFWPLYSLWPEFALANLAQRRQKAFKKRINQPIKELFPTEAKNHFFVIVVAICLFVCFRNLRNFNTVRPGLSCSKSGQHCSLDNSIHFDRTYPLDNER